MRHIPPFLFLPVLLAAALLASTGCLSRSALESSVREDRSRAANSWSNRLTGAETETPRIAGSLVLADALKLALANNKALRSISLEKEIAAGRTTEAYSEALPDLTARSAYSRVGPAESPVQGTTQADADPYDLYSASLSVRQPLYRGGIIGSALRGARLYAYWADELVRGQIQSVLFDTAAAFYEVLLAERLQTVAQSSLDSSHLQLKTARDMAAEGAASRYDVLRAEVAVANSQSDVIQQQNRRRLARNRLFQIMGVVADPGLAISGDLAFEKAAPRLDDALRAAHQNRPDLFQADLMIRMQREVLTIAKGRYYPSIYGVAARDWTRRDNHAVGANEWQDSWVAGVEAEFPIFDGLAREGRVKQEEVLLQRRETELSGAEELVLLEINQALASLEDAEKLVESQQVNLIRAREALSLAESGFSEGVNTGSDLADARTALRLAEGLHAQALYAHTISRLSLRRAIGALDPKDADPARLKEFPTGANP
jgi:outer membrane protein TolC